MCTGSLICEMFPVPRKVLIVLAICALMVVTHLSSNLYWRQYYETRYQQRIVDWGFGRQWDNSRTFLTSKTQGCNNTPNGTKKNATSPHYRQEFTKDVAALTGQIKYSFEILRATNRSSSVRDLSSLIQHQLNGLEQILEVTKWREEKISMLSRKIETTIQSLQNPENCSSSKKLYCDIRNPAGLASGVHDFLWCALNAYLSRSMLVVMSRNWHYTRQGWNEVFRPLSHKCRKEIETEAPTKWPGRCDDDHRHSLVHLPEDIEKELRLLGTNPLPWWYGQLLGNLLKPSDHIASRIINITKALDFQSPIAGIHIRRTDKIGKEGAFHSVDEYMKPVQHYFDTLQVNGTKLRKKRVFLATDDPKAIQELQKKYPEYRFLHNQRSSNTAEKLNTRYQQEAKEWATIDMFMISRVDYLVCSLSSGFSRLAYELMLYYKPDGLNNVFSVDTEYYYAGAANPPRVAVLRHDVEGDLELKPGDILEQPYFTSLQDDATNGKMFDGFSRAVNNRTKKEGNYPLYKTIPVYFTMKVNATGSGH